MIWWLIPCWGYSRKLATPETGVTITVVVRSDGQAVGAGSDGIVAVVRRDQTL